MALTVPQILVWLFFLTRRPVTGGALIHALLVCVVLTWLVLLLPAGGQISLSCT